MEINPEDIQGTFEDSKSTSQYELTNAFFSIFNTSDIISCEGKRSYLKLVQPLIFLLNMMSLVLPSDNIVEGYSDGIWFFSAINYLRLDALAWNFGLQTIGAIMAAIFVFLPAMLMGFLLYCELAKVKRSQNLVLIIHTLAITSIKAFRELALVPISCMLLSMVKYGLTENNPAEYVDASSSEINVAYSIVGVVALPFFVIEVCIATLLVFQIDFNSYKDNWFARPHSIVQLRTLLVVWTMCILEFTHDFTSPQLYLSFSAILLAYICYLHAYYLPYYNNWTNTIYISLFAFLTSTSLSSMLAFHFESADVIIVTSLIMFPCYFVLAHNFVKKRSTTMNRKVKDCRTPFEAMIIIKNYIINLDDAAIEEKKPAEDRLRDGFSELSRYFDDSIMEKLWTSLYYCFKVDNPALAKETLNKLLDKGTIDCKFLVFQLHRHYSGLVFDEDHEYTVQIAIVKECDRQVCFKLTQAYDLLLASKNDSNSIQSLISPIYNLLMKTKRGYKRLSQMNNKRPEALELYRYFMWNVMNDYTNTLFLVFKANEKVVLDETNKKVLFTDNRRESTPQLAFETHMVPESHTNIPSVSTASLSVRLDNFKKLKRDILFRGKRVKMILAISFIIVLGIMVGLMTTINYFIADLVSISTISTLGSRRMLAIMIATHSRTLQLIDEGQFEGDLDKTRQDLEAVVIRFTSAEDTAERERKLGHDLGKDEKIPTWEWQPNITQNIVSGREAALQLIRHAKQLTSSTQREAAYYGIRNGIGETMAFFNTTLFKYIDDETSARFNMISFIALMMTSGLIIILLIYLSILAPNILFLETNSRKSYNQIKQLSRDNLIESRHRLFERLEIVHGEEPLALERDRQRTTAYRLVWPKLALKFCVFVTATILIGLSAFFIYMYRLNDLVWSNPHYSNWAGMRRVTLQQTYFWSRELYLSNQGVGYFDLINTNQIQYSYKEQITNATGTLYWADKAITKTIAKAGIITVGKSAKRTKMIYDAYSSDLTQLDFGINGGLQEFYNLVGYFAENPEISHLKELETLSSSLILAMEDLMTEHQEYINNEVDTTSSYLMLLLLVYGVLLVVLYVYYEHVIAVTSLQIIALARLYPMVPDGKQAEISDKSDYR